jgi:hypothetical protein
MGRSNVESGTALGEVPGHASSDHDPIRRFFAVLPRPLRFLGVGGLGMITDLAVFTLIIAQTPQPLLARLASLAIATLVTWRLNRALTFDHSGRRTADSRDINRPSAGAYRHGGGESVSEDGMSLRKHPGRPSTKSAPNARDGVTRPSPAGSELILEEISRALFAVKS